LTEYGTILLLKSRGAESIKTALLSLGWAPLAQSGLIFNDPLAWVFP
jgi:hypothetical protein